MDDCSPYTIYSSSEFNIKFNHSKWVEWCSFSCIGSSCEYSAFNFFALHYLVINYVFLCHN